METWWWLLGGGDETDRKSGRSGSPVPAPGVGEGPRRSGGGADDVASAGREAPRSSGGRDRPRESRESGGHKGDRASVASKEGSERGDGKSTAGEGEGGGDGDGADGPPIPPALPSALVDLSLPAGPSVEGKHVHSRLDASKFRVRGQKYVTDGKKVPAAPSLLDLVWVEVFRSDEPIKRLAMRPGSYLRYMREAGDKRRYLAIAFQTPADGTHLLLYFAAPLSRLSGAPSHVRRVWDRFWAGESTGDVDAFRKERWKVIPSVADGAWAVQTYVGDKPALLANKLTHTFTRDDSLDVLEVDCDVASSSAAAFLVGVLHTYSSGLVIDLAFTVEGHDESELPEQVLGSVRLSRIDIPSMTRVADYGAWAPKPKAGAAAAGGGTA